MRRRLVVAGLGLAALSGCSARPLADAAQPAPGPMPSGGSWRGVYQGPYHIALNIWVQGSRASGTWRAVGDREGEFFGTTFGNLLVINWSEHASGKAERWSGRGYFVYSAGKPGAPAQIYGEWGMGRSSRSSTWWAVKRANDPVGVEAGRLIDKDADEQYRDDAPGCEMGNCDVQDTEQE